LKGVGLGVGYISSMDIDTEIKLKVAPMPSNDAYLASLLTSSEDQVVKYGSSDMLQDQSHGCVARQLK
jgi:hypothetical protein